MFNFRCMTKVHAGLLQMCICFHPNLLFPLNLAGVYPQLFIRHVSMTRRVYPFVAIGKLRAIASVEATLRRHL